MHTMTFFISTCVSIFALFVSGEAAEISDQKVRMLYNSLDPYSISQHLAFYELYAHKQEGQQALQHAWQLLSGQRLPSHSPFNLKELPFTESALNSIVMLINKPIDQKSPVIKSEDLQIINRLSNRLAHLHLKGYTAQSEKDVLSLPTEEIDLARGLFLSQFGPDIPKIQAYEAMIDLMALQILARLPDQATPEAKIRAINQFIFEEMGFRFPPHSLYAKDIDLYTFLPSVLDSRRGVCLGVSILYLCLAQRLALPLEMITPPGHIYVRYRTPQTTLNIETTARGIHLDSEEYLSVETKALQQRTIKEVIGLAHFNQAAAFIQQGDYVSALNAYQKAEPYLQNDPLLKEFLGYSYLFVGNRQWGERLLNEVKDYVPDYAIVKNTIAEDYLNGEVDASSIQVLFKQVDEDRQSILVKKQLLEEILKRYPRFRAGILQLAVAWIQLHRAGEALEVLKYYHTVDPHDPETNYYLAVLYGQRHDYNLAWEHLRKAESIVQSRDYHPKVLKELRRALMHYCPE